MDTFSEVNLMYVLALCNALVLFATAAILRGEPARRAGAEAESAEAAIEGATARLLERLDTVEQRLAALETLAREQAEIPAAARREAGRYGEALRMVGGGAAPDELVTRCGLSRGEADLIVRLHGNRHRGGADIARVVP